MPRKKMIGGYAHPIERTKLYDVPAIELAKSIIDKDPISHIHIPMLADKAGVKVRHLRRSLTHDLKERNPVLKIGLSQISFFHRHKSPVGYVIG